MNNSTSYQIPTLPLAVELETKAILKQVSAANKQLAGLKYIAEKIPNRQILINTLALQEAKDSSAVENIVTTHDDLFRANLNMHSLAISASAKEVLKYSQALREGFEQVRDKKLLTNSIIQSIQLVLEGNSAGFRKVPGTTLKNQYGEVVYMPPQTSEEIVRHMQNLETFINNDELADIDPLIKMAIIHHQFESIHPFYDGNGRTGRIVNVLYLVLKDLLELPILYLSRYIIQNKGEYYRLLQAVRDGKQWEAWVLFMLKAVEVTAMETITLVKSIDRLMLEYKHKMRPLLGHSYRHELLNNLFKHPYTKIDYVMEDMEVTRITATRYLNLLVSNGLLHKETVGRNNYYLNMPLVELLMQPINLSAAGGEQIITDNPSK